MSTLTLISNKSVSALTYSWRNFEKRAPGLKSHDETRPSEGGNSSSHSLPASCDLQGCRTCLHAAHSRDATLELVTARKFLNHRDEKSTEPSSTNMLCMKPELVFVIKASDNPQKDFHEGKELEVDPHFWNVACGPKSRAERIPCHL